MHGLRIRGCGTRIRELERLEAAAITEDEFLSTLDALRTAADTSRGAAQRVARAARNAIMGRPVASVVSWRENLAAVSAADVPPPRSPPAPGTASKSSGGSTPAACTGKRSYGAGASRKPSPNTRTPETTRLTAAEPS